MHAVGTLLGLATLIVAFAVEPSLVRSAVAEWLSLRFRLDRPLFD